MDAIGRTHPVSRSYAASLGALAMSLVVFRGIVRGELADAVAAEAIVALVIFAAVGGVAGWIADYLIRDALETLFRKRVDWYRQALIEMASEEAANNDDS